MNDFLDFNSANNQYSTSEKLDTDDIRNDLLSRIDEALNYLLPQGYVQNNCFYIGDTEGNKGKSLVVQLQEISKEAGLILLLIKAVIFLIYGLRSEAMAKMNFPNF